MIRELKLIAGIRSGPAARRCRMPWRLATTVAPGLAVIGLCGCGGASTAADPSPRSEAAPKEDAAQAAEPVDLDEIVLRQTRPLENSTINVRFTPYAVASAENAPRLNRLLKARRHQAREQAIVAVRTTETWEFDEPELKRLRRRIQFRLNRWLNEPLVEDIVLTDFRIRID